MDDYKEQDDSDLQRIKLFREWLHTAPHGEFHSINEKWNDEATLGFRVDFAITRLIMREEEEDDGQLDLF